MAPTPPSFGAPRETRGAPLPAASGDELDAPAWAIEFLRDARVGRLATAGAGGQPLVVPVCFALAGRVLYSPVDAKPKRTRELRRLRNIADNPLVSLVADRWDEDWTRLQWVIVEGRADLLGPGPEFAGAIDRLRDKYPQYRAMGLSRDDGVVVRIAVSRTLAWRVE